LESGNPNSVVTSSSVLEAFSGRPLEPKRATMGKVESPVNPSELVKPTQNLAALARVVHKKHIAAEAAVKAGLRRAKEPNQLQRTTFSFSRAGEYFDVRQLQTMTGQPFNCFHNVLIKELGDNAIDAAEQAGVAPLLFIKFRQTKNHLVLIVGDNGPGIAPDILARILDYSTLTSDKSAYRGITRGQQGNAFKTIVGIPFALKNKAPVVVEAQGVRHIIRAKVDPAGNVSVDCDQKPATERPGTRVALAIPTTRDLARVIHQWGREFSLFNPHLGVQIWEIGQTSNLGKSAPPKKRKIGNLYRPTLKNTGDFKKPLPTDPTSPWWYDDPSFAKLVFAHVGAQAHKPFRGFLSEFAGMSRTPKLKAVCDQFPNIKTMGDFTDESDAPYLLSLMKAQTKAPSASTLGEVGEEHFRQRFGEWYGISRLWYKKVAVNARASFVVEVALAEVQSPAHFFYGINFSPTFEDPLAGTCFSVFHEYHQGLKPLLGFLHVRNGHGRHYAVAFHLISPVLEFLDKGKTRLKPTNEMVRATEKAVKAVCKEVYQEGKRRERDAARQERADRERDNPHAARVKFTEIMDQIIPEAVALAGGNEYQVSAHTVFYKARPLCQKLTSKELISAYFEQTLLPAYQRRHGPILLPDGRPAIYYEPRGVLYEPHSGVEVPLGTREVANYLFPSWLYNKILFIEKQGLWPTFQRAMLAELYDMAIVAGEGYATEACRVLLANADKAKDYQLFVLHDADHYGKNIALKLRKASQRMPGHKANVIDLGLTLADGLAMGLEPEEYVRRKALPSDLELTDLEREYFGGEQKTYGSKPSWLCKRIEYNALSAQQQIDYAIRKLKAAGIRPKLIPPDKALRVTANEHFAVVVASMVEQVARETISLEDIIAKIQNQLRKDVAFKEARHWVEKRFKTRPTESWTAALKERVNTMVARHSGKIKNATVKLILESLER
jgi:hypothetical protein